MTRYRGAGFIEEFRHMLNHTGGVWFYFIPEEKPSTDPKKPNPPEVAPLSSHFAGKAWLDLRSLAFSSVRSVEVCSSLAGSADAAYVLADEPSLASSRSFVRLSLELSRNMAKPDPAESNIALEQLLPKHEKVSKYPSSNDAACIYVECVERCLQHMFRDCSRGAFKESVPGVIEVLKEAGSYNEIRQDLRAAIVHVTRERLRKDTHIVPGKPLEGDVRREFMSDLYTYLTSAMTHVLDDLRKSATPGLGACAGAPGSLTGLSAHGSVAATPDGFRLPDGRGPRRSQSKAHSTPDGGSTPAGKAGPRATLVVPEEPSNASCSPSRARVSALLQSFDELSSPSGRRLAADERMDSRAGAEGTEDSFDPQYPQPVNSIAAVLVESASVRRARESLNAAVHPGMRCERLALEAEMVGNWDRAAQNTQNRLVLEEYSHDPHAWILYAKFCARSRGRQAAAEEALRQAVKLLADPGVPRLPETEREVDFMLACLLLDRERHDEAIRVFRVWHQKDFTDPLCRFLLGLALFLADEEAEAMPLLQSVARPRTWFEGVDSDRAVAEKLRACVDGPEINVASYVACLEKLLDFGLPTLTLTFIDQCGILPPEILRSEPIALMDAKACVMDRDYTGALRTLEKLISRGDASRETFRLAGETYAMVQEFDRALQALMQALNFEPKFTEPVVYVRLGHVFLAKKRWKHARDAFLRSIQFMPTAEAWNGVAYAEYRSEELQTSYEALCEASLLDNEKPELWALLALVHLRFRNFDAADHSLKQCLRFDPDCFDLLLEVSAELSRKGLKPELAECLARSSLHAKDSGPGHAALADALAQQGQAEPAVAESLTAIEMLVDQPDQRRGVFERALKLCEELPDGAALSEAVQDAQRIADLRHAERAQSPV